MNPNTPAFVLNNENPFKFFLIQYALSTVSIKKIIINSLLDKQPVEWFSELSKLGLCLEISTKNINGSTTTEPPITFISQVTTTHRNPVFEFENFVIPEANINNRDSHNFDTEVRIELKSNKGKLPENVLVTVFYEAMPGVTIK